MQDEIDEGVMFWGYEEAGALAGVMGIQLVQDVALVRHAYVRTKPEGKYWGALAIPVAGGGKRADVDRHVGGCGVGDPLL